MEIAYIYKSVTWNIGNKNELGFQIFFNGDTFQAKNLDILAQHISIDYKHVPIVTTRLPEGVSGSYIKPGERKDSDIKGAIWNKLLDDAEMKGLKECMSKYSVKFIKYNS